MLLVNRSRNTDNNADGTSSVHDEKNAEAGGMLDQTEVSPDLILHANMNIKVCIV